MKLLFLVLIMGFNLAACRLQLGTDTGNPVTDTGNPKDEPPSNSFANKAANSLCISLVKCYANINAATCETALKTTIGLATDFGFTTHSTLDDISNDVDAKYNEASLKSCLDTIHNLPCSSLTMTSSYSEASPGNFNSSYQLLHASTNCANVSDPSGVLANPTIILGGQQN